MPQLTIEQFGDLLKTTLKGYTRTNYVSLLADKTDYPAAKQLIRKSRMTSDSGTDCTWEVEMPTQTSFANISITDQDQVDIRDAFVEATVNWRKSKTAYAFVEEEMTVNRGEWALIKLIKSREARCDFDFVKGMEENFWNDPSSSDTLTPYGLPYWAPKGATQGHNGTVLSGFSDVAGISTTTYPNWKSYTDAYTDPILSDLIFKMRLMAEKTDFKPPVENIPDLGKRGKRGYYSNIDVKMKFEDAVDARNDNLGTDLAKNDNQVMFRGVPFSYVPFLDDDTTDPLYQIDWGVFKVKVQNGWWQKRTVLAPWPGQRNMTGVFKDTIYNFVCYNRRLLGVISTGTSYPS